MKNGLRRFAILGVLVLFSCLVLLIGCGKKSATKIQEDVVVNLKIGLPNGFDVTPKEILELFEEKNPDIKISIDDAPWGDYEKRVQLQMMSKDCPDIWFLESGTIMSYGALGVAENLTAFVEEKKKSGKYLMLEDTKDEEGNVWGIPHALQPTALAYNKESFQEAGLVYPDDKWTFYDLINIAKKLTQKDVNGEIVQYGFAPAYSITVGYYPWIKGLGGDVLDETKTKSFLNSSATKKAIERWAALAHEERVFPPYTSHKAARGSRNMFGTGKAAMFFIQYVEANMLNKEFPNLKWNVAPIPKSVTGKRFIPYVANSWVIYKKAKPKAKEAAKRWLDFWLSDEVQFILAKKGDNIPANRDAFAKVEKNLPAPANRNVFIDYLDEAGANLDLNSTWNSWNPTVAAVMERIYGQRVGVNKGITEMHNEVEKILAKGVR